MKLSAFRPILVVTPVLWVGVIGAATFIASRQTVGVPAYGLSAAVYEVASFVCHQLPERSFHFRGAQMPVCARCVGLYVGAAAAAIMAAGMRRSNHRRIWDRARTLLLIGAVPTAVTLFYEWFSGNMPSHWIRAAAGFPLGAIVMLIILAAATPESVVEIH
jgi:uncharacterized membrane protein